MQRSITPGASRELVRGRAAAPRGGRRLAWSLAMLSCCAASACASDEDLVHRCRQLRDQVVAEGSAALLQAATSARLPHAALAEIPRYLGLEPGEHLLILSNDGEPVYSSTPATEPADPGPLRGEARRHAARTRNGSTAYYDVDGAAAQAVRREVAWADLAGGPDSAVLLLERSTPVGRVRGTPVIGKWLGAYSHTAHVAQDGGAPPAESKSAGQLSVLAVQNGDRVLIRCASPEWQITADGLVVGERFTAAGGRPGEDGGFGEIWFVEGEYDRSGDRIRGTVSSVGPGRIDRRTFFLQPVVPRSRAGPDADDNW